MSLSTVAQIRTVARSGDIIRAWTMFGQAELMQSTDPDVLSLKGRLLKDRALRADGTTSRALLSEAQQAYMQAATGRRATYPLINAATLAFLNDRPWEAAQLACNVQALLESGDHEPETRYWLKATAAEAYLLLGDADAGHSALVEAIAATPDAWEDHAATLRQFHQILAYQGVSTAILDPLRPPPSLYFSGIIGLPDDEDEVRQQIEHALDAMRPGAAFGALAAGADIVIAELAIARGAQLHIVLPTGLNSFRETSVVPFGHDWAARFDRLIATADSIELPQITDELSDAAVAKGNAIAMGFAVRRAEALATRAMALHVGRTSDPCMPSHRLWQERGLPLHAIALPLSAPPPGGPLKEERNRMILASVAPLTTDARRSAAGVHFLVLDDPETAMVTAGAILRASPDCGLALEYRTVAPSDPIEEEDGLAQLLARVAPPGGICMPWLDATAMTLCLADCRFEFAGEVMTQHGDCPIGHYYPPSD